MLLMLISQTPRYSIASIQNDTCYSVDKIHQLAEFKKSCDKCQLDLKDTREALNSCVQPSNAMFAAEHVLGGFVGGAVVVFIVCSLTRICGG